jgi:antitoxin component of RelBE/YafQ-DinJ toxin-antitoxin module
MYVIYGVYKTKSKNMTSAVIVNIDRKIKKQAMRMAKSRGIPLSAVIKLSVRAFVEGRFDVEMTETLNERTRRSFEKAEKDHVKGRNISPVFTTVAQSKKWLDN